MTLSHRWTLFCSFYFLSFFLFYDLELGRSICLSSVAYRFFPHLRKQLSIQYLIRWVDQYEELILIALLNG